MPEFGKRQNKTNVKCRGSENVKTNGGRLSRGSGNATANDGTKNKKHVLII